MTAGHSIPDAHHAIPAHPTCPHCDKVGAAALQVVASLDELKLCDPAAWNEVCALAPHLAEAVQELSGEVDLDLLG